MFLLIKQGFIVLLSFVLLTNIVPINSDDKKVRYKMSFYILNSFISGHITIHNSSYLLLLHKKILAH